MNGTEKAREPNKSSSWRRKSSILLRLRMIMMMIVWNGRRRRICCCSRGDVKFIWEMVDGINEVFYKWNYINCCQCDDDDDEKQWQGKWRGEETKVLLLQWQCQKYHRLHKSSLVDRIFDLICGYNGKWNLKLWTCHRSAN